jgi:hypothetical protein
MCVSVDNMILKIVKGLMVSNGMPFTPGFVSLCVCVCVRACVFLKFFSFSGR